MPAAGGDGAAGAARAAAVHRRGGPAVAHGHQVQVAGGWGGAQAAQRPRQLVTPYVSTAILHLPNHHHHHTQLVMADVSVYCR